MEYPDPSPPAWVPTAKVSARMLQ